MRRQDLQDKEQSRAAVRQVADEYLSDSNITSVGVGYKVTDGKRTKTLSLQFTVGTKFGPEGLEAAATRPIPPRSRPTGSPSRQTSSNALSSSSRPPSYPSRRLFASSAWTRCSRA